MESQSYQIVLAIIVITTILVIVLAAFIVLTILQHQKKHLAYKRYVEEIKSDTEKKILTTKLEIQEETFKHISREIHDNIALSLSLAKLNLNRFSTPLIKGQQLLIDSSIEQVSKALNDLSDISRSLDSKLIESHGLFRALEMEIGRLEKAGLLSVEINETGDALYLDTQRELLLFRIVQEAFNNILKHSKASRVKISISYNNDIFKLSVADNGIGFCENDLLEKKKTRIMAGLNNIRMRATMLKGNSEIESEPGKGTIINITIPIKETDFKNERTN